jgi:hypothetical protein
MDNDLRNERPVTGRRRFLRQFGITAAATATAVGLLDVAGMKPAHAAAKASDDLYPAMYCTYEHGACGGPCSPSGVWCHWCDVLANGGTGNYLCIGGPDSFTLYRSE